MKLFVVILLVMTITPLKVIDQRVYQTDRVGRVLTEKGGYNLKDKSFTDGKGRKSYAPRWNIEKQKK